jgi:hypothetical protein
MQTIRVKDFSSFPGGRFKRYGDDSGEQFRDEVLVKALACGETIEIDLSEIFAYQPSFLDEAFAGLIKLGIITAEDFKEKFVFKADRANIPNIALIKRYVNEAAMQQARTPVTH